MGVYKRPRESWFDANLRCRYGITIKEWKRLYRKQKGRCAICLKKAGRGRRGLHVDHNHKTGKLRGLMCPPCNRGLERLKSHLDRAVKYFLQ